MATNNGERILSVDVVRGFALMGLFVVHMVEYFELYWYKPEPGWVHESDVTTSEVMPNHIIGVWPEG